MSSITTGFTAISDAPLDDAFATIADSPFEFIELPMSRWDAAWLADAHETVASAAEAVDAGLVVHLPYGAPHESLAASDADLRAESMAWYEQNILAAAAAGATKAVVHVETDADSPHLAEADPAMLYETLETLDARADDAGITLCVENLPNRYPSLDDLRQLVEATDVALTVDTGHARVNGFAFEEIVAFVADHHDRIAHFHLNDTRRARDEHLPFGAGDVAFGELFAALGSGWSGTLTTEINTFDYDYIRFSGQKLRDVLATITA